MLYFIFLGLFVILAATLLIVRCYYEFSKFWTSLVALGSLIELAAWIFMGVFLYRDGHFTSLTIMGVALAFHVMTNVTLFLCVARLRRSDVGFQQHRDAYSCATGCALGFSMITSHKFY